MLQDRIFQEFDALFSNCIVGTLQTFSQHEHSRLIAYKVLKFDFVGGKMLVDQATDVIILVSESFSEESEGRLTNWSPDTFYDSLAKIR